MRSIKILATFFRIISVILILFVISFILIPNLLGMTPQIDYLGTMSPKIKKGSISYINKNIKYESIKKDDIVGINIRNQQITSRVLKVNEDKMLETKGDKEPKEEIIVITKEEYLGRVALTIPYIGSILIFFHKHFVLTTIFILIIIAVLTLDFVLDKNKDYPEKIKKQEEKPKQDDKKNQNDKIENKDTNNNKNKEKNTNTKKNKDKKKQKEKNNDKEITKEKEITEEKGITEEKEITDEKGITEEKEIKKENEIKGIYEDIDII